MITIRDGEVSSAVVALIREAMEIRHLNLVQLAVLMDVSPPRIHQLLVVNGPYRSQGNMLHKIIVTLELELEVQIVDPSQGVYNPEGHPWWNKVEEIQESTDFPDLSATARALEAFDRALLAESELSPGAFPEAVQKAREATDKASEAVGTAFAADTANRNDPITARSAAPSQWIRDLIKTWKKQGG